MLIVNIYSSITFDILAFQSTLVCDLDFQWVWFFLYTLKIYSFFQFYFAFVKTHISRVKVSCFAQIFLPLCYFFHVNVIFNVVVSEFLRFRLSRSVVPHLLSTSALCNAPLSSIPSSCKAVLQLNFLTFRFTLSYVKIFLWKGRPLQVPLCCIYLRDFAPLCSNLVGSSMWLEFFVRMLTRSIRLLLCSSSLSIAPTWPSFFFFSPPLLTWWSSYSWLDSTEHFPSLSLPRCSPAC